VRWVDQGAGQCHISVLWQLREACDFLLFCLDPRRISPAILFWRAELRCLGGSSVGGGADGALQTIALPGGPRESPVPPGVYFPDLPDGGELDLESDRHPDVERGRRSNVAHVPITDAAAATAPV